MTRHRLEPVEQPPDGLFHGGRIIALEPVKQAVRDEALYIGRAYFKYHASIPTLTAIPETRHPNRARTCAPAPFLCRSDRPKIARLLLFQLSRFFALQRCEDYTINSAAVQQRDPF